MSEWSIAHTHFYNMCFSLSIYMILLFQSAFFHVETHKA